MEAISHAGTVLAVMSKEGIAMAAEKVSPTSIVLGDGNHVLTRLESYRKAP
jgi:20S proteasome alpha/beta subunit